MCGENHNRSLVEAAKLGSPPHVRGKLVISRLIAQKVGITPACAGKTLKNPYPINVCQSLRFLFL